MKETLFLMTIIGLILHSECQVSRLKRQVSDACRTPNGLSGVCYNIRQCPSLLDLLRKSRNNPDTRDFLRKSVCGYDSNDPRVCCPNPSAQQPVGSSMNNAGINNGNPQRSNDSFPKLPSPPQCGYSSISHTRIVGGSPAQLGSWPWMAALGYKKQKNAPTSFLCGGTLITNKHVVTAAHCTQHPTLTLHVVRLGDLNIDDRVEDNATPIDCEIEKAVAHPGYDARRHTKDIALIYLKQTVRFTDLIKPICLPKSELLINNNFGKKAPFVIGWGSVKYRGPSSSALLEVQVPVVPNAECQAAYSRLGATITSNEICAGHITTGGKDACLGDSGGPMMVPEGGLFYYLIGVISYGHGCAEPGYPGIYARTTAFIDWIHRSI